MDEKFNPFSGEEISLEGHKQRIDFEGRINSFKNIPKEIKDLLIQKIKEAERKGVEQNFIGLILEFTLKAIIAFDMCFTEGGLDRISQVFDEFEILVMEGVDSHKKLN